MIKIYLNDCFQFNLDIDKYYFEFREHHPLDTEKAFILPTSHPLHEISSKYQFFDEDDLDMFLEEYTYDIFRQIIIDRKKILELNKFFFENYPNVKGFLKITKIEDISFYWLLLATMSVKVTNIEMFQNKIPFDKDDIFIGSHEVSDDIKKYNSIDDFESVQ